MVLEGRKRERIDENWKQEQLHEFQGWDRIYKSPILKSPFKNIQAIYRPNSSD